MNLSVIIINYKTKEMTAKAVDSVLPFLKKADGEVILIDNNSEDGSADFFQKKYGGRESIVIIENKRNLGFAGAVNQGIKKSRGELILLLNSDALISEDAVQKMAAALDDPSVGVVGPKIIYPDGRLQLSFGRLPALASELATFLQLYRILPVGTVTAKNFLTKKKFERGGEAGWVSGCAMMFRRGFAREIGLFDENFFFGFEDMDFCLRVKKAGRKVAYLPGAEAVHYHSYSAGGTKSPKKVLLERDGALYYLRKNNGLNKFNLFLIKKLYDFKAEFLERRAKRLRSKVKDVVLAVTYRCNSRCRMCGIWERQPEKNEFSPSYLKNLPASVKDVNLTGGEPFLRDDLIGIARALKERLPRARVVISTNGFATDLIAKKTREILKIFPNLGVAVSIDGLGENHNKVRGVPGGFKKAMATVERLKSIGVKNLKIAFTIGDYNFNELKGVYKLACSIGTEFPLSAVHSGDVFFNKQNSIREIENVTGEIDWLVRQEIKSFRLKNVGRAYYARGLKKFIQSGSRLLPDYSGRYSVFIDPCGNVYPNNVSNIKIGSLKTPGLLSPELKLSGADLPPNWMGCTVRQSIKKHWFKSGMWVIISKLKTVIQISKPAEIKK